MSLASKYTPEQLENILVHYEFLADNCGIFEIFIEGGGSERFFPYCVAEGFGKAVDIAIEYLTDVSQQ